MSFPSLVAPVNISTDLVDSVALRTTAALRYADHHLNAASSSVFLPEQGGNVELFCVSQSCITFPIENLKERLQNTRIHSERLIPVDSEMWVENLGKTSITFGHVITFEGNILASMTRIYVRKNVKTGMLLEVSEKERSDLFPATARQDLLLPFVDRLEVPVKSEMKHIFNVRIGPQHCNNDHVDHAALADLLLQGLFIKGYSCEMNKLSIRYLAPSELNQTLSVYVDKDRPLAALYIEEPMSPLVIGEVEITTRNKL